MAGLFAALWFSSWIWQVQVLLGDETFIHQHGALVQVRTDVHRPIGVRHLFLWDRVDSPPAVTGNPARKSQVLVNYLVAMVLFGLWPIGCMCVESVYHGKRERLGMCRRCGFDLRGNRGACPECGLSTWNRGLVIDHRRWRSLAMKAGAVGLLLLLIASGLGAWLGWAYSVEQKSLRMLAKVSLRVDTAPVGPGSIAQAARQLDLGFFERVVSLSIGAKAVDQDLVHLRSLRHLQELRITSAGVSDAGLVHLQALHGLQTLDLSGTQVSDQGIMLLASLANLQQVDLSATNVKHALRLRRVRPHLVIASVPPGAASVATKLMPPAGPQANLRRGTSWQHKPSSPAGKAPTVGRRQLPLTKTTASKVRKIQRPDTGSPLAELTDGFATRNLNALSRTSSSKSPSPSTPYVVNQAFNRIKSDYQIDASKWHNAVEVSAADATPARSVTTSVNLENRPKTAAFNLAGTGDSSAAPHGFAINGHGVYKSGWKSNAPMLGVRTTPLTGAGSLVGRQPFHAGHVSTPNRATGRVDTQMTRYRIHARPSAFPTGRAGSSALNRSVPGMPR